MVVLTCYSAPLMSSASHLKYLGAYPANVLSQVQRLIAEDRLADHLRQRYPDLELRLRSLHPYEVPEIIAVPILTGSAAYLSWLAAEVADRPAAHGSGPAGRAKGTETA